MESLFEISMTEGWELVLYNIWDNVGIEKVPKENQNVYYTILILFMITVINLFVLNMFIGILVETYTKIQDKTSKSYYLFIKNHIFNHKRECK
jgi:hypothetical protein